MNEHEGHDRHSHHHHHHHHHHELTAEPEIDQVTSRPNGRADTGPLSPLTEEPDSTESNKGTGQHMERDESPVSERTHLLRTASTPSGTVNPRYRRSVRAHHGSAICRHFLDDRSSREWFNFLRRKTHHHHEEPFTSNRRCESSADEDEFEEVHEDDDDVDVESGLAGIVHEHPTVNQRHAIVNTLVGTRPVCSPCTALRNHLTVQVLQSGIMIHSFIVGFTLSIKDGAEFSTC